MNDVISDALEHRSSPASPAPYVVILDGRGGDQTVTITDETAFESHWIASDCAVSLEDRR